MLSLKEYHFPETIVKANPHWKGGDISLGNVDINPSIVKDPGTGNYFYNLIVSNEGDEKNTDVTYQFSIYAFAVFEVEAGIETTENEDQIAADIAYQGASILFGVVRDHLFSITSKSAWSGVQLPIYRFKDEDFEGKFFLMEKPDTDSPATN